MFMNSVLRVTSSLVYSFLKWNQAVSLLSCLLHRSEHERHSPNCPFVKGEYTHNVPLSVTYATSPALTHSERAEEVAFISNTNSHQFIASATRHGSIVVWNTAKELKVLAIKSRKWRKSVKLMFYTEWWYFLMLWNKRYLIFQQIFFYVDRNLKSQQFSYRVFFSIAERSQFFHWSIRFDNIR